MIDPEVEEGIVSAWKASRARRALAKFWNRIAPAGTEVDEPQAALLALVLLECYENALRDISARRGPNGRIAREALAYKRITLETGSPVDEIAGNYPAVPIAAIRKVSAFLSARPTPISHGTRCRYGRLCQAFGI